MAQLRSVASYCSRTERRTFLAALASDFSKLLVSHWPRYQFLQASRVDSSCEFMASCRPDGPGAVVRHHLSATV